VAKQTTKEEYGWSGYPDPADPDNYWIDDVTGERVCANTGQRFATNVEPDFAHLTLEMHMRSEGEL
jgi:hypothetical protein